MKRESTRGGIIDFRYAPSFWQSTYCFPDDPHKSLVGKNGELLYGHPGVGADLSVFRHVISVRIQDRGEPVFTGQSLDASQIPIVTTRIAYGNINLVLTSFATNNRREGRTDNLLIQICPEGDAVDCAPVISIKSQEEFWVGNIEHPSALNGHTGIMRLGTEDGQLFLLVDSPVEFDPVHRFYSLQAGQASREKTLTYFVRFPREGQSPAEILPGMSQFYRLLDEARGYWQPWKPVRGDLAWNHGGQYQDFLFASARNIVQAREVKKGKKIFQVGTTTYRGLWIVDGDFLLEAARYLGRDKEAQEGLEAMWDLQGKDGGILASAGEAHWKDTAAALHALSRQAELAQNWNYFKKMWRHAQRGITHLQNLRDNARADGSVNGKYGLLPNGFGDSGIGGIRSEFTNTLWALIGLKSIIETGRRLGLEDVAEAEKFYDELHSSFLTAAAAEMRQHHNGFSYLPMLMREDPKWSDPNERERPRVQSAQVYVSHAIYPGLLFSPHDPLVNGHVELMKAVTLEEIPSETGWLANKGVWTYNAPIVAQVYLWLGMKELARKTFDGFLNHASPLYCWREEQSLQGSDPEHYIGDMPHNWASAECIRFLRHCLVLEDGTQMRLFEGMVEEDMDLQDDFTLTYTPTRWGRVSLTLQPQGEKTWRAKFKREGVLRKAAPKLSAVICPYKLFGVLTFEKVSGAGTIERQDGLHVDPSAKEWEMSWKL